ncbi:DUF1588 domain-containing protein [Verrucomicrobiaceae bacterium 227]
MFRCALVLSFSLATQSSADEALPDPATDFLLDHCYDCHDSASTKGDFDLEALKFNPSNREDFEKWTLVYDRIRDGEMPPKKKKQPAPDEKEAFLKSLATPLIEADEERIAQHGRSKVRRLNRHEYENTLREVLGTPWLQVADRLPEDGTAHLFHKSGEQLDVSHVQMTAYLGTARHALQLALQEAAHPTSKEKFHARDEGGMAGNLPYRFGQASATRATIPLLGLTPQPEIIRNKQPVTVGASNPEVREQEAFGFVCGTYTATTKYDFRRMNIPTDGKYRIRMKTYSFMAGPNGASGGDDHGLTGGSSKWWRPSRTVALRAQRSEPITLYSVAESGDSRWLTTFDSHPDPAVIEREVFLKKGEDIRPDASRLVRTRPGWGGNANATKEGVPGFAMNWLEVEGPLHESWPPPGYQALFGDRPFEVKSGVVKVKDGNTKDLILAFMRRSYLREVAESEATPFIKIFERAGELEEDFTEAMLTAYSAILSSPDFLYLAPLGNELSKPELATRLSYFLWNGPPDSELLTAGNPLAQSERLLKDPRAERFINAFLDSWLDLRDINSDAPDAELYPDYYLDDLLTESSLRETRLYFTHLIENNLPVRTLIDSDFSFVNERLARHYDLPPFEGVEPRLVKLPADSPRGGLLTQASVLRVTANGTTTSPVLRGVWIVERLLGIHISPPPSGVSAVEPDTRGATTIREQLDLHRSSTSCKACHIKMDPAGFALENFDIAGAWRDQYRATGNGAKAAEGIGHNGHLFRFHYAQAVDASGVLPNEEAFQDIREFKKLLIKDERQLARNMVQQFMTYATGAPISFSERDEIEKILDACQDDHFGIRSLIHGVVQSPLFRKK